MRTPIAALAIALVLVAAPAFAQGGLMDDMSKVRDNFFYKTYTGMLGNEARNGDQWSNLRLRELDKAVTMAENGKKYNETSWWNPIDKVSTGYNAWQSSNQYFEASTQRREWEKKLADAGITPNGKRREEAAESTVKFLGNFSQTAREGGKLLDQMKKVEDSSYKYHQTSWLNPIDKISRGQDALKEAADANVMYKNFKNVAQNDPFVRFGTQVAGIGTKLFGSDSGSLLGNLFGGNNRTGSRDVYAGGSNTPRNTGRITDIFSGGGNTPGSSDAFGLDGLTRDINRATNDMKRSFDEIRISIKGMKRQFSTGMAEIGRPSSQAGTCVGPNCPPAPQVKVNQLIDKLSGSGIK